MVSGPANALPREWARAWQVCRAGDAERMEQVRAVLESFHRGTHAAGGRRTIACFKRALLSMGVIGNATVAAGTPSSIQQRKFFKGVNRKMKKGQIRFCESKNQGIESNEALK